MQPHTIFVDQITGLATTSPTGPTVPNLKVLLGARLTLNVAFHTSGVIAAITSYTADSLRLAVKKADDIDSTTSLLPLGAWSASGSGTTTRYQLIVELDSEQLQAAIGDNPEITVRAQLEWMISTQTEPRLSFPFDLTIVNSPARSDDGAPDTTGDAGFTWLTSQLAAGTGIKLSNNTETHVATISTGGSFGRVTTDTNAFSAAWTTIFTIPVEANTTYQLECSMIAALDNNDFMRVIGDLISGCTAHGLWAPIYAADASVEATPPYTFNAGAGDELIYNLSGTSRTFVSRLQSFLLITTGTAGNIIIKARSNDAASGVIKAGSHYVLTKLT
jgi:hypothetical protein